MSDADDGAEIVELFPGAERTDADAPLRTRPRDPDERWSYCRHLRLDLHMKSRRVYCRDCGDEIPAFDALDSLRGEWERYVTARKHAIRQAKDVKARLAELEKQEKNTKARVRRLRTQLPPTLSVQEIDYVVRFIQANKGEWTTFDALFARLQAMRDEIEPPTA